VAAHEDELAAIAETLRRCAEQLADVALDRLWAAVDPDDPDGAAATLERRITRARRAVERAVAILDGASPDDVP